MQAQTDQELEREFATISEKLADTSTFYLEQDWNERMSALRRVQELINEGAYSSPNFASHFLRFVGPLGIQLGDLRSAVVKEAAKTVKIAADACGPSFELCAERLSNVLFKLCNSGTKVIADTGHQCMLDLISTVPTWRFLPKIAEQTSSKNAGIRAKAAHYLEMILETYPVEVFENQRVIDLIEPSLKSSVHDAGGEARASGRRAFLAYRGLFPDRAKRLFTSFDISVQKALGDSSGNSTGSSFNKASPMRSNSASKSMRSTGPVKKEQSKMGGSAKGSKDKQFGFDVSSTGGSFAAGNLSKDTEAPPKRYSTRDKNQYSYAGYQSSPSSAKETKGSSYIERMEREAPIKEATPKNSGYKPRDNSYKDKDLANRDKEITYKSREPPKEKPTGYKEGYKARESLYKEKESGFKDKEIGYKAREASYKEKDIMYKGLNKEPTYKEKEGSKDILYRTSSFKEPTESVYSSYIEEPRSAKPPKKAEDPDQYDAIIEKTYNENWSTRFTAFERLFKKLITKEIDESSVGSLISTLIDHLTDLHFKVQIAVFRILKHLIETIPETLSFYLEKILPRLIICLGDNKENIASEASDTFDLVIDIYMPEDLLVLIMRHPVDEIRAKARPKLLEIIFTLTETSTEYLDSPQNVRTLLSKSLQLTTDASHLWNACAKIIDCCSIKYPGIQSVLLELTAPEQAQIRRLIPGLLPPEVQRERPKPKAEVFNPTEGFRPPQQINKPNNQPQIGNIESTLHTALGNVTDDSPQIRFSGFQVLKDLCANQARLMGQYLEMSIERLIKAVYIEEKHTQQAAEEVIELLVNGQDPGNCIPVLVTLIGKEEVPATQALIRITTKTIRRIGSEKLIRFMRIVMDMLKACFNHSNADVRKSVVFCLVEIHGILENKFDEYMDELSSSQQKLVTIYIQRKLLSS